MTKVSKGLRSKWVALEVAKVAEVYVARYLEWKRPGVRADVARLEFDSRGVLRQNHWDDGDIKVTYPSGVIHYNEVKWHDYFYTGRRDWPHWDFIVDAKPTFDAKQRKPDWYFFVNVDGSYIGQLSVRASVDLYHEVERTCKYTGKRKLFYSMKKRDMGSHVMFSKIEPEFRDAFPLVTMGKKELTKTMEAKVDAAIRGLG